MRNEKLKEVKKLLRYADTEERVLKVDGIVKTIATVNKHTGEVLETWNYIDLGEGMRPESETRF
jgi:hypothetical protein